MGGTGSLQACGPLFFSSLLSLEFELLLGSKSPDTFFSSCGHYLILAEWLSACYSIYVACQTLQALFLVVLKVRLSQLDWFLVVWRLLPLAWKASSVPNRAGYTKNQPSWMEPLGLVGFLWKSGGDRVEGGSSWLGLLCLQVWLRCRCLWRRLQGQIRRTASFLLAISEK